MKKIVIYLTILMLFIPGLSLFAPTLDVGKDKIVKVNNMVITVQELEKKYNEIKKVPQVDTSKLSKKQVLDMMISNELFREELKKDTIVLDRNQYASMMDNVKNQFIQIKKREDPSFEYSDEKFRRYIEQEAKITYEKFDEQMKEQILMKQYVMKKAESKIAKLRDKTYSSPADFPVYIPNFVNGQVNSYNSIEEYYDTNIQQFVQPKSVELKHIFLLTVAVGADNQPVELPESEKNVKYKKMLDIRKRLLKGESFSTLCELYSEDTESRDRVNPNTGKVDRGYLGVLLRNDDRTRMQFGDQVFNSVFNLEKGQYSEVLESKVGYHIFYCADKKAQYIVALNEARQEIINLFLYVEQSKIIEDTMEATLKDLKAKASIVYYKDEYK